MSDTTDPIHELIVAARRKQILDAATHLFAEKGFHRATIKEIAQAAGIADGTVYTYFSSKMEVLFAILHRLNETSERAQHFATGGEQDPRTFFRAYVQQRMEHLWPDAEVLRAILPEMLVNAELRERYYQQVLAPNFAVSEQFFQAQNQSPTLDASLTIRTIAATFLGLLLLPLMGDQETAERWEELPETLTTLFFDGLASQLVRAAEPSSKQGRPGEESPTRQDRPGEEEPARQEDHQ